ncbi:MAG: penicillin-binding transpeptidase domain-containing protein [Thermoleophilaceae bacterium]
MRGRDPFVVNNYEKQYSGVSSLAAATEQSDNSVYAELGLKVGTRKIARLARRMGIQTEVSTNPAMILGGLETGVTPLEMAYAYSTIANGGKRVRGSLSTTSGPVAVEKVERGGEVLDENERRSERVYPEVIGESAKNILSGVITAGTGQAADIGEFAAGKTGTTENYGDAWFVGFNREYTVAVWVGYPDRLKYMETEYAGGPVAGGTYPALIWRDFLTGAIRIRDQRDPDKQAPPVVPGQPVPTPGVPQAPVTPSPVPSGPVETTPTPAETVPEQTTPVPSAPESGAGGDGTGGGGTGTGGGGTTGGGGGAGGGTSGGGTSGGGAGSP